MSIQSTKVKLSELSGSYRSNILLSDDLFLMTTGNRSNDFESKTVTSKTIGNYLSVDYILSTLHNTLNLTYELSDKISGDISSNINAVSCKIIEISDHVPENIGTDEKFATETDITNIYDLIDLISDLIPEDTSTNNKLVNKNQLENETRIDDKTIIRDSETYTLEVGQIAAENIEINPGSNQFVINSPDKSMSFFCDENDIQYKIGRKVNNITDTLTINADKITQKHGIGDEFVFSFDKTNPNANTVVVSSDLTSSYATKQEIQDKIDMDQISSEMWSFYIEDNDGVTSKRDYKMIFFKQ